MGESQDKSQDGAATLSVYLAEYNNLQAEVIKRMDTQNQAFNFLLIIIGAAITAVVSIQNADHHPAMQYIFLATALFLPITICPLGFVFFDNEMMIHAIGSLVFYDRRLHLARLANDPDVIANILGFPYLPGFTLRIFPKVSRGRWILFCLPTYPSLAIAALSLFQQRSYLWNHKAALVSAGFLFALDTWACFTLAQAIWWVFVNANFQARQHEQLFRTEPNAKVGAGQHRTPPSAATS